MRWPPPTVQRDASADAEFDSSVFEADGVAFVRAAGRAVRVQPRARADAAQDLFVLLNHAGDCRAALVGQDVVQVSARSILVVRDAEIEGIEMPGAFRHVVLRLARERLEPRVDAADPAPRQLFRADRGYARAFFECATEASPPSAPPSPAEGGLIADTVLNLLALTMRGAERECPRPQNPGHRQQRQCVLDYVRAHLHDPTLSARTIAKALGMSTRYLHRLFEHQPLSLMETVWRERTEHCAQALLAHPQKTINEIAFAFGFSDQAHFNHRFRTQFGRSPRAYVAGMAPRTHARPRASRAC